MAAAGRAGDCHGGEPIATLLGDLEKPPGHPHPAPADPALPPADLLRRQAEWLAPARARLLRGAGIAHRRRVLDLGAGRGAVTAEIARRAGGSVVGADIRLDALRGESEAWTSPTATTSPSWSPSPSTSASTARVCCDGCALPFAAAAFDLVFTQLVWLWVASESRSTHMATEVRRVLAPGGVLVAIEPDYGGAIEHPPSIAVADIWIAALRRAGADPFVGRRLPALLGDRGFDVRVDLLPQLHAPARERFDLLRGLPLTADERRRVDAADRRDVALAGEGAWTTVVHVPFVLVTATRT